MSRSEYHDDLDNWSLICWRGAVASAIRGKKGQVFLKELLAALDALPVARLAKGGLETYEDEDGIPEYCALGAVGHARNLDMSAIDPYENTTGVAQFFGIPRALAAEIQYMNDEYVWYEETPEARFTRMRQWVVDNLKKETP